jgi:truncated hemoglobin YjbI
MLRSVTGVKPLTVPQYERMANDLQRMSDQIRARPEMNHHFAERLAVLAKEMREDEARAHPAVQPE